MYGGWGVGGGIKKKILPLGISVYSIIIGQMGSSMMRPQVNGIIHKPNLVSPIFLSIVRAKYNLLLVPQKAKEIIAQQGVFASHTSNPVQMPNTTYSLEANQA